MLSYVNLMEFISKVFFEDEWIYTDQNSAKIPLKVKVS